jgi:hypothetical protein
MGEPGGMSQRAIQPEITTLAGKILEIRTGPCEHTTGKSLSGTHLIVKENGKKLNIHLGPEEAVGHVIDQLAIGSWVTFDIFHTERMPENAYIAKSLTFDDEIIRLRDDNLRHSWTSGRDRGKHKGKGLKVRSVE